MKLTLDQIQSSVDSFQLTTSDELSNAFKVAKTRQDDYSPPSKEFKLLERFKQSILKQIRANRKSPSIEELDELAHIHNEGLANGD